MIRRGWADFKGRDALRVIILLSLFAIFAGLITDLLLGLPVSRGARSWLAWLGGMLALGVVYFLGGWVAERIHARDNVAHPLWNRVWHLLLLLGFAAVMGLLAVAAIRIWK